MTLRNDWTREEIQALYEQPFLDLVFKAQQVHREHFTANTIQVSTLYLLKRVNVLKIANIALNLHITIQN